MLKIRLQRTGRRNNPSYRVVVTEHTHGSKSQKHADRVGFYNPNTKEKKLDAEKIKYWISVGAKASGTVHNMLIKEGIIKGQTINVLPQKTPVVKKEEEKEEAPVAEEAVEVDTTEDASESKEIKEEKTESKDIKEEIKEEDGKTKENNTDDVDSSETPDKVATKE